MNFRKIYGKIFDYVICINGRDSSSLNNLDVEILIQSSIEGCPKPKGVAWKLYPPRLNSEVHEIFIDHDVVLVDRIPKVDLFLSMQDAFMYSQSFSKDGEYGRFRNSVTQGFRLNSGFFGLPPGFSFLLEGLPEWEGYFDEQGFVASTFCRQKNLIRVELNDLWICMDDNLPMGVKGYHFCKTNRNVSWSNFVEKTTI
jgi:hypothetical protein